MSSVELRQAPGPIAGLLSLRQAWLTIETNRRATEFVQTRVGGLALCAAFIVLLAFSRQLSTAALGLVSLTLVGMTLLPRHSLSILGGSSLFYFVMRPFRIDGWAQLLANKAELMPFGGVLGLQIFAVGTVLALAFAFLSLQRQRPDLLVSKRPALTIILSWFAILGLALALPTTTAAHALAWSVVGVFISSLWIFAYSAMDAKGKDNTPVPMRAIFLRPFWGGSAAPIGKSFGFLNRFAAKDAEDLAVTRLKALKLAVWALILAAVLKVVEYVSYDLAGLQHLQTAILAHAEGQSFGAGVNWASLIINYFIDLLIISVWGHFIVAVVRMAGYRIPRNTVNPLASRTLAEFWNRYFYYFKELLVDFFFYPAFTRYFKSNLKLRIAFATFCAAGAGNFLYHFMRETHVFADGAIVERFSTFHSAIFYSAALATGLIVSQWRNKKLAPENGFLAYHVRPRLTVFFFFCFLKIFDDISGEGSLTERAAFATSLFGV